MPIAACWFARPNRILLSHLLNLKAADRKWTQERRGTAGSAIMETIDRFFLLVERNVLKKALDRQLGERGSALPIYRSHTARRDELVQCGRAQKTTTMYSTACCAAVALVGNIVGYLF